VFAFVLDHDNGAELSYSVFDVSAGLREAGWLVPAYTFPATARTCPRCASSCATGPLTTLPTCFSMIFAGCWTDSGGRPPHNVAASRHPSPTAQIPTVTPESRPLAAELDNAAEPTALTDAEVYAMTDSLGDVGPALSGADPEGLTRLCSELRPSDVRVRGDLHAAGDHQAV
jgi:hypothetical protein